MILVVSGTDRANSNSRRVANHVFSLFQKYGVEAELIDLADLKPTAHGGPHYGGINAPDVLAADLRKVEQADGIYLVVAEYNGSMPGALKYFVDHWKYPDAFEFRPFALAGLGTTWGGLRAVEHMQGSLGYRNAFLYPERVFVRDVWKHFKEGPELKDPQLLELFDKQVRGFAAFVKALQAAGLDANSRLAGKP